MKVLSLAVDNALRDKSIRYGYLAEIDCFFGPQRFWSGLGTLSYGGFNWKGAGLLGSVGGVGETAEIRTNETHYVLSGITDTVEISNFLTYPVRGYSAKAWLALMDENFRVMPDPILVDQSILDTASVSVADDLTSTLVLTATSAIFDFRRPVGLAITNEQQQIDFPGDTGFDRMPTEVADKVISWTRT